MVKDKANNLKIPFMLISGAVLMAVVLMLLMGRPLWNSVQKKRVELKDKKQKLTLLQDKLENLKTLESREAELKQKNEKVLAALPADKDVSRLFIQMESVAAASGVNVNQVTESQTSGSGSSELIKQVFYTATGETKGYTSLKDSLSKFETALRLLSIPSIDISTEQGKLRVNLNMTTYTRNEK